MIIALDFGGTKLTAALLDSEKRSWLCQRQIFLPSGSVGRDQYEAMLGLAQGMIATWGKPQAVGVSFGGPVFAPAGLVRLSYHIPGWENTPLADWLQTELGVPVAVDNDANAAALGEFHFGAWRGCRNLLYVTVSTGIGGGWIVNGWPYWGADGLAGEIGHIRVQANGLPCDCGQRGCLEAEASGLAIARRAKFYLEKRKRQGKQLRLLADHNLENITAKLVSQAAAEGDKLSQAVLDVAAVRLGHGLATAITLMNPDKVILGGGVTKSGERWWQIVRETACGQTFQGMGVEIVPALLGDDAPLWGAAALAEISHVGTVFKMHCLRAVPKL